MKTSKIKSFVFGMVFFIGAIVLSTNPTFSQELEPSDYEFRWKQRVCPSTGQTYETCWASGDGNICQTYNESTRSCPGW